MNERPTTSPEKKEIGLPHAKEIWLMDDSEPGGEVMGRLLGPVLDETGYSYGYYSRGAKVLEEINKRREAGNGQPHVIIMDGRFSPEDPIRYGSRAIETIRALDITQPTILAYSSDPELNENMLKAGANQVLSKPSSAEEINAMVGDIITAK